MRQIDNAAVLVVGASGGLGGALCAVLRRRGARLCLASRRPIEAAPGEATFCGDLRERDFGAAAVKHALEALGRLDGVISASGVVAFGALETTDDDTLEALFSVNTLGPLRLLRAFLPHGRGGFFVSLSGVVAEAPLLGLSAYGASKAALSLATRAAAMESRRHDIDVIDARPPHTETGLATRPLAGRAPRLPPGKDPVAVAERIVRAIEQRERELPASAFA